MTDDLIPEEDLTEEETEPAEVLAISVSTGGERLDKWLADTLPDRSRAEVQRWIKEGRVTLNGATLKSSYRVIEGDSLQVIIPAPEQYEVEPEPIPLDILYEDDDLLVINKQPGLVVHPAAGNWHGTLVNAVLYHCPALEGVGGTNRPGIVHRLDKDTSGVILVAKNDRSHRDLQAQFKNRAVHKTYLALVYGHIATSKGEISAPIGRDPRQRKRMAVVPAHLGRPAVTRYETVNYYGNYTLVACQPLTGRTHQIRVHMAYIRHPLVGDVVYGGKRKMAVALPRQFLHAERIRFRLPSTGEEVEFRAPLPPDLTAVLAALSG